MWFRLALGWGCTVREAQARCDAQEFSEWLAYWRLEPWGSDADDRRHAIACTVTANGLYKRKFDPEDFRVNDLRKPRPSLAELRQKVRATFGALGIGNRRKPKREAHDEQSGVQQRAK